MDDKTDSVPKPFVAADAHHGRGGSYIVIDGKRVAADPVTGKPLAAGDSDGNVVPINRSK